LSRRARSDEGEEKRMSGDTEDEAGQLPPDTVLGGFATAG
jgi:hypothetical protein